MGGKLTSFLSSIRHATSFRQSLPHGLEKEFIEYKDIKSIDRINVPAWTCKIMKKVDALHPQIQHLLDPLQAESIHMYGGSSDEKQMAIAPLILAYITPITLKFRPDEKRLDVDGSYNIRYEMLKKRIDKAVLSGTSERLTQPGYISIVYTQDQEVAAYEKHLYYLVKKNLIQPGWEHLQLEPMQGVDGIKALRAHVIS